MHWLERPVIFYRASEMSAEELEAAKNAGFRTTDSRVKINVGAACRIVIGRYSVLPYYRETAEDIKAMGGYLVNDHREHSYIADMRNWVEDLKELTPKTWYHLDEFLSEKRQGSFVLKGMTNSRKDRWKTHMHAETQDQVPEVYERLLADGLIGQAGEAHQNIYIREYVPLVSYAHGIGGLPITKEFRFFVYGDQVLCGAYYWSSWADSCLDADPKWKEPTVEEVPQAFLQQIIDRIGDRAAFYAVDVGQDESGRWWVIEVNDGQMSGLSGNKASILYKRLFEVLTG